MMPTKFLFVRTPREEIDFARSPKWDKGKGDIMYLDRYMHASKLFVTLEGRGPPMADDFISGGRTTNY
jgi:hypothetical protein